MMLETRKNRERIRYAAGYLLLLVALAIVLFPIFYMVSMSFKPETEIFSDILRLVPEHPTLENYLALFDPRLTSFPRYFINSLIVATSAAFIAVAVSAFAGYSFARLRFRGKGVFLGITVGQQMFPAILILISLFIILTRLGLVNSYPGLILIHAAFAIPFCVLLFQGYFAGIPPDLEEAAMIDGCSRAGAVLRVVLPVVAPAVVAATVFAFLVSWHEYLFAFTIMRTDDMRTLTAGVSLFKEQYRLMWGMIMAASVVIFTPMVVFFAFLQKYMISGLTMGAVKK